MKRNCCTAANRRQKNSSAVPTIQKYGALRTMQELIRKGRVSETFDALAQKARLELTAEALVTDSRFGALFTDDEVNACFMLLCEYGFFG